MPIPNPSTGQALHRSLGFLDKIWTKTAKKRGSDALLTLSKSLYNGWMKPSTAKVDIFSDSQIIFLAGVFKGFYQFLQDDSHRNSLLG